VGTLVAGPLGPLAGALLGGNTTKILFTAELVNGQRFIGICDAKIFASPVGQVETRKASQPLANSLSEWKIIASNLSQIQHKSVN
jgi:hypothetical protein